MEQLFTGRADYLVDHHAGKHPLLVAVPILMDGLDYRFYALFDTAAPWCMLEPRLARELGYDFVIDPDEPSIHTRLGTKRGRLVRHTVSFAARDGADLDIEATWFICEDWDGPNVIGWKGCLERMRFAIDPSDNVIYFAEV